MKALTENLDWVQSRIEKAQPIEKVGRVVQVTGLIVESDGPEVSLGDVVQIYSQRKSFAVSSEVVGFRENRVLLMPLGEIKDIHAGCRTVATKLNDSVPVGNKLLGRVINGLGNPIDDLGPLRSEHVDGIEGQAPNPMMARLSTTPAGPASHGSSGRPNAARPASSTIPVIR